MDDRSLPSVPEPEPDPATAAFTRLEGEIALLRRAVEHLATEKAEIEIPDYSSTLAEMAKRLVAIEGKPAMEMTPEEMAARMNTAAVAARREDRATLAEVKQQHGEATYALRGLLGTVTGIAEQRRRLLWTAGGSLFAGILLWAVLPGFIARLAPTSWHWPERIAARTVREPTLWEAGVQIMRADSPGAWQAIAVAADMRRDNREAIDACEQTATKSKQPVQCTLRIRKPPS